MKNRTCWALIIATVLLGVAAWASVTTDYDRSANFANYKTYSWGRLQAPDSMWEQRVKNAINSQLAAKGWTQVPSGGDVVVNALGIAHLERQGNVSWNGMGPWGGGAFGTATATPSTYPVGTLVIQMFDAKSKNLIWRGISSETLSEKSNKDTKKLDKDVDKMFKNFPLGTSGK